MQKKYSRKSGQHLYAESGFAIATVEKDPIGRAFARKRIKFSVHQLRNPKAIAFDNTALAQAEQLGVEYVVVQDIETAKNYCAELWKFREHGLKFDRGFSPQTALLMGYWTEGAQPPMSLFDVTQTPMMGLGVAA